MFLFVMTDSEDVLST